MPGSRTPLRRTTPPITPTTRASTETTGHTQPETRPRGGSRRSVLDRVRLGGPGDVRRRVGSGASGVRQAHGGAVAADRAAPSGVAASARARGARCRRRARVSGAVSSLLAGVLVAHAVLTLHGVPAGLGGAAGPCRPYGASVRRGPCTAGGTCVAVVTAAPVAGGRGR